MSRSGNVTSTGVELDQKDSKKSVPARHDDVPTKSMSAGSDVALKKYGPLALHTAGVGAALGAMELGSLVDGSNVDGLAVGAIVGMLVGAEI